MDIVTDKQTTPIHAKQLLGELNNGFMLSLIIYSKENSASDALLKYDCTLRAMGSILEDTFKVVDMLQEDINCKDYVSVTNYGFKINKRFFDIHEELAMIEIDKKVSIEGVDSANKEFVEECVQSVRACLSYLNNKFGYYD